MSSDGKPCRIGAVRFSPEIGHENALVSQQKLKMIKQPIETILTGAQVRAARVLLNLSGAELGRLCRLPRSVIYRFESTGRLPQPMFRRTQDHVDRMGAIRHALEAAGAEFIAQDGAGPGVRLARRAP